MSEIRVRGVAFPVFPANITLYNFLKAPDEEIERTLNIALEIGYRHIDGAPVYLNEKAIGKVLRKCIDSGKVKREDLFVVTKLPKHGI